jgi:branched-chain amino acid transport system substrate-binding protein
MPITRRRLLAAAGATILSPAVARAGVTVPIRIGEISSYSTAAGFTQPYRRGWQLAIERLNANGGLLGREVEVVSHDDEGKPSVAIRIADELVRGQNVDLLAGGYLSNVGLAISDYSRQNRILFVASEPMTDALVWSNGHRYCYRLRSSTYMQAAMLVEGAAKLAATRWVTVAPNYEYGHAAVSWFKELLGRRRPDVRFISDQWPPLGQIDAGAVANALAKDNPEAILNVTFGADLAKFVREGSDRGLFKNRSVASFTTGEPEYLDPLGEDAPPGWIVTGYPVNELGSDPQNSPFISAYSSRYSEMPGMGSVVGYAMVNSIAAPIRKLRSLDTEMLVDAFAGTSFETPFGSATWRTIDHQSTLGAFVGRIELKDKRGIMTGWRYVDGASVLPSDDEVRRLRPPT